MKRGANSASPNGNRGDDDGGYFDEGGEECETDYMMVMIIRAMGLVTVIIIFLNTWASPRGLESEGNEILIKMRRRRIED